MKVFLPEDDNRIGGGWTFMRNFKNGMERHFPDLKITHDWQDADLLLVPGVTLVDRDVLEEASKAGKPIVWRVDNVPRKSRNRRSRVYDNMRRFVELADAVVYQSEWARSYCKPMCGGNDGMIIYNGVDTRIFYPGDQSEHPRVLFIYHGKNEQKGFTEAHLRFQLFFREHPDAEFWFVNDFGRGTESLIDAGFDFWNGEKYRSLPLLTSPQQVADVMRQCTHFFYPAIADAAPNVVLEARACGLRVMHLATAELSGSIELMDENLDISLQRMCREYYSLFNLLLAGEQEVKI